MSDADTPDWIDDPEVIVFAGERPLPPGAIEQHGIGGAFGKLFPRRVEAVRQDWDQRVEQLRTLLEGVPPDAGQYTLEEVTFELGFSAQGQIVFVAQAGVTTTISATFKRQGPRRDSPAKEAGA